MASVWNLKVQLAASYDEAKERKRQTKFCLLIFWCLNSVAFLLEIFLQQKYLSVETNETRVYKYLMLIFFKKLKLQLEKAEIKLPNFCVFILDP